MPGRTADARCVVVVGCQWGDEGKGKIVDVLAEEMDVVARYQGGANAGHTVIVADEQFILHQIPSGILHPDKRCLLGNGVVVDLVQFFQEYDGLAARGIQLEGRVGVSRRAHLLLPYHRVMDQAAEENAAGAKIGTTGRGIGPAYQDKVGRRGIRVADALDEKRFRDLVARGSEAAREALAGMGRADAPDWSRDLDACLALRERLVALATETGLEIEKALARGERVLLEGAQGTALDLDHGTYPYVTSSNTTAAAAATGVGIGPTRISGVLGVVKAYTTRVGNGPFPIGFDPEMDARVRELGGEFGATTGRPRRCGWFDGVLARYSARVNGLTGLAVTKLDVLDTLPEVAIATGYQGEDGPIEYFPAEISGLEEVKPILEFMPGWQTSTRGARSLADLPENARRYLDRIEAVTGAPVEMVGVGAGRAQIIRTR